MTTSVNLILICDRSGSLAGEWMAAVNSGIRGALPRAQQACGDTWVRAIAFAGGAAWHIEKPVKCGAFEWIDLQAGGDSDLGSALQLLEGGTGLPKSGPDAAATVLVLITDGWPTGEYSAALHAVEERLAGQGVVRAVVPVGPDIDRQTLLEFLGDAEAKLVATTTPAQLKARIGLVVEEAVRAATKPVKPLRVAALVAGPPTVIPPPPLAPAAAPAPPAAAPAPPAAAPVPPAVAPVTPAAAPAPPPAAPVPPVVAPAPPAAAPVTPAATPVPAAPAPSPAPDPAVAPPPGRVVITSGDEANALALQMYVFRPGQGAAVLVDTGAAMQSGASLGISGRTRCHCGAEAPLSLVFHGKRETRNLRCAGCGMSTSLKLSGRTPPGVHGVFISLEWFDAARPCTLEIDTAGDIADGSGE
jgi:uncharacterized protein YegL